MKMNGERPTAEQVRKAREKAGMTQAEAAALVYQKWRSWHLWEKGERQMSPALWELWRIKARLEELELGPPK